jgi:hypothetical protein
MQGCFKNFEHPEKYTNKAADNMAITWNGSRSLPYSLVNTTSSAQMRLYCKKNQVAKR